MRVDSDASAAAVAEVPVRLERPAPGLAVLAIDRPEKRNALSLAMMRRLRLHLETLARDDDVRAVVLTGRGGCFSAGADVGEFASLRGDSAGGADYEAEVEACEVALGELAKPTVAAISGYCLGGGLALAMECDFRIADATALFAVPAANLGTVYTVRECRALHRVLGLAGAKRLLYTGQRIDAAEALAIGLVDRLCGPGEDVLAAAVAFAGDALAGRAPLSIAGHKLILHALADGTTSECARQIEAVLARALDSEDYREGVAAFAGKRAPRFRGR